MGSQLLRLLQLLKHSQLVQPQLALLPPLVQLLRLVLLPLVLLREQAQRVHLQHVRAPAYGLDEPDGCRADQGVPPQRPPRARHANR